MCVLLTFLGMAPQSVNHRVTVGIGVTGEVCRDARQSAAGSGTAAVQAATVWAAAVYAAATWLQGRPGTMTA